MIKSLYKYPIILFVFWCLVYTYIMVIVEPHNFRKDLVSSLIEILTSIEALLIIYFPSFVTTLALKAKTVGSFLIYFLIGSAIMVVLYPVVVGVDTLDMTGFIVFLPVVTVVSFLVGIVCRLLYNRAYLKK